MSIKKFKNAKDIKNELFSSCAYVDKDYPPSIVLRGKHDAYDEAGRHITEPFNKKQVEYVTYCVKSILEFHAVAIAPINKEGKKR